MSAVGGRVDIVGLDAEFPLLMETVIEGKSKSRRT
jgi:hypothetical protein